MPITTIIWLFVVVMENIRSNLGRIAEAGASASKGEVLVFHYCRPG